MSNPWLAIPLSDYEGHMNSPEVQQLAALSDLFAEALARSAPTSVTILGIAGGNGLERIESKTTKRVVGVDVNPAYLDAVRKRYAGVHGLELHCVDLVENKVTLEPTDLVFAGLIFEHAGTERCLENAVGLVGQGGTLGVVLQLPSTTTQGVAPSAFTSMHALKTNFCLIDPESLCRELAIRKFRLIYEMQRQLPAGKSFWMGLFGRV